jgi:uncharacterized coiled-coil protein SlyX
MSHFIHISVTLFQIKQLEEKLAEQQKLIEGKSEIIQSTETTVDSLKRQIEAKDKEIAQLEVCFFSPGDLLAKSGRP